MSLTLLAHRVVKLRYGEKATVTLTRLSTKSLDDDNLRGAFKAVRDEVALVLGLDDADERIVWSYGQERAREMGVRITIEVHA